MGCPLCWKKTATLINRTLSCIPTLCAIFWIIYLLFWSTWSTCFDSVCVCLEISTSGVSPCRPIYTLNLHTYDIPLNFFTLILVLSIKSSSNKQRRLCFSRLIKMPMMPFDLIVSFKKKSKFRTFDRGVDFTAAETPCLRWLSCLYWNNWGYHDRFCNGQTAWSLKFDQFW